MLLCKWKPSLRGNDHHHVFAPNNHQALRSFYYPTYFSYHDQFEIHFNGFGVAPIRGYMVIKLDILGTEFLVSVVLWWIWDKDCTRVTAPGQLIKILVSRGISVWYCLIPLLVILCTNIKCTSLNFSWHKMSKLQLTQWTYASTFYVQLRFCVTFAYC